MGRMAIVLNIIFIMRKDLDTTIMASSKPHHCYSPYASKSQKEDLYTISKLSAVYLCSCVYLLYSWILWKWEARKNIFLLLVFGVCNNNNTLFNVWFCALFTAWYWHSWWTCSWYHHSLASFMASHISNLHQRMYQWLCWILVSSFWLDDRRAMTEFIVM